MLTHTARSSLFVVELRQKWPERCAAAASSEGLVNEAGEAGGRRNISEVSASQKGEPAEQAERVHAGTAPFAGTSQFCVLERRSFFARLFVPGLDCRPAHGTRRFRRSQER